MRSPVMVMVMAPLLFRGGTTYPGHPKRTTVGRPPSVHLAEEAIENTQDCEGHPPQGPRTLFPVPPNTESAEFIAEQLSGDSMSCHGLIRSCRPDEEAITLTRKSVQELLPPPTPLLNHEVKKLQVAKFLRESSQYFGAATPLPVLKRIKIRNLLQGLQAENQPGTLGGSSS